MLLVPGRSLWFSTRDIYDSARDEIEIDVVSWMFQTCAHTCESRVFLAMDNNLV